MLDTLFSGLFDSELTTVIAVQDFLLCVGCALVIGLILAGCYMYRTRYTRGFVATLALLPAVVCVVIMMVNGNVGTGVAVAGAFSLVRFRSVPGSAKEICIIFLAMGTGLVVGMGYLGYAFLFAILLGGMTVVYSRLGFGARKKGSSTRRFTSRFQRIWTTPASSIRSWKNTLLTLNLPKYAQPTWAACSD